MITRRSARAAKLACVHARRLYLDVRAGRAQLTYESFRIVEIPGRRHRTRNARVCDSKITRNFRSLIPQLFHSNPVITLLDSIHSFLMLPDFSSIMGISYFLNTFFARSSILFFCPDNLRFRFTCSSSSAMTSLTKSLFLSIL